MEEYHTDSQNDLFAGYLNFTQEFNITFHNNLLTYNFITLSLSENVLDINLETMLKYSSQTDSFPQLR